MAETVAFADVTARFQLPLLHVAQTQKEVFVNEAHALTDSLLHAAVEGEASSPPAVVADGECWIVATAAAEDFDGMDGTIACRQAGQWLFIQPAIGMRVYDKTLGADRRFVDGWTAGEAIAVPSGGDTIDIEARDAITHLLEALRSSGILPTG